MYGKLLRSLASTGWTPPFASQGTGHPGWWGSHLPEFHASRGVPGLHGFRLGMLVVAALMTLAPVLFAGFWAKRARGIFERIGETRLVVLSGLLCLPYGLVSGAYGRISWAWLGAYLAIGPVVLVGLGWARRRDPEQRGIWVDWVVLLFLGLAVDLRWLERAWPAHLSVFGKMVLVDVGILGFLGVRGLRGVGFDLRLRGRDLWVGGREFVMYAPAAVALGLALGFLHWHGGWPRPWMFVEAPVFTFLLIAVPEELFFRGWMQNLLERRLGRRWALGVTAVLFGLSHFNKRAVHFNWRYVVLAALAGVFYGRAWRADRRVGASAVTHTLVDSVWSLFLR